MALLNINVAEWGDSYRILRASEYIKDFEYPSDEKRPPLYSFVLALSPEGFDQVGFARLMMFGISLVSLLLFIKLCDLVFKNVLIKNISLAFFILNPVYLYWSLRVMSDVFFSMIVLASLFFFIKYQQN